MISGRLSKEEIDRMLKEAELFREEDYKIRIRMEARHRLECYTYAARDAIDECGNKLTTQEKVIFRYLCRMMNYTSVYVLIVTSEQIICLWEVV